MPVAVSSEDEIELLPPQFRPVACRAAEEGIPVAAIARMLIQPSALVHQTLKHHAEQGDILEVPMMDWPPGGSKFKRMPAFTAGYTSDDLMFLCQTVFKLTKLEASMMVMLLKHTRCDKLKLHNVVEQRRFQRSTQPNSIDETDPKMVDVIICKLRKKLTHIDPALLIKTVWGDGYYLEPSVKDLAFDLLKKVAAPDAA